MSSIIRGPVLINRQSLFKTRFVSTYPLLGLTNRFTNEKVSMVWRHVVMIGSMRGVLSVALVGMLPESDFKNILQTMTRLA